LKLSYIEGLAIHDGPESCIGVRKGEDEALTGVRAGWVLSREIHAPPQGGLLWGADALEESGRQHPRRRSGKTSRDPTRSETPRMHASTSFGNREIPLLSAAAMAVDRIGKSQDARR
jgi:RNA-directed DNA polymerase